MKAALAMLVVLGFAIADLRAHEPFQSGRFQWTLSPPLVGPAQRADDPCYGVKDPTIVRRRA